MEIANEIDKILHETEHLSNSDIKLYIHIYLYTYKYIYTYIIVYIYIYIYIYIYTYIIYKHILMKKDGNINDLLFCPCLSWSSTICFDSWQYHASNINYWVMLHFQKVLSIYKLLNLCMLTIPTTYLEKFGSLFCSKIYIDVQAWGVEVKI